jgi:hypothetical protein
MLFKEKLKVQSLGLIIIIYLEKGEISENNTAHSFSLKMDELKKVIKTKKSLARGDESDFMIRI